MQGFLNEFSRYPLAAWQFTDLTMPASASSSLAARITFYDANGDRLPLPIIPLTAIPRLSSDLINSFILTGNDWWNMTAQNADTGVRFSMKDQIFAQAAGVRIEPIGDNFGIRISNKSWVNLPSRSTYFLGTALKSKDYLDKDYRRPSVFDYSFLASGATSGSLTGFWVDSKGYRIGEVASFSVATADSVPFVPFIMGLHATATPVVDEPEGNRQIVGFVGTTDKPLYMDLYGLNVDSEVSTFISNYSLYPVIPAGPILLGDVDPYILGAGVTNGTSTSTTTTTSGSTTVSEVAENPFNIAIKSDPGASSTFYVEVWDANKKTLGTGATSTPLCTVTTTASTLNQLWNAATSVDLPAGSEGGVITLVTGSIVVNTGANDTGTAILYAPTANSAYRLSVANDQLVFGIN